MALTTIEEDLIKIFQPMIKHAVLQDNSNDDIFLLPEELDAKIKLDIVSSLKSYFKSNINKSNLGIIMSKQLHNIFSNVLFRFLNDNDQNVRIAADECINLIIRLTSFSFSPYVIYNVFYEMKLFQSPRSIKGALQKFSALCNYIKHSKRISYINNVLPTMKTILSTTNDSILVSVVKYLPKIAENLFYYSSDHDIENSIIQPLIFNIESTDEATNQRVISQILGITISYMKDVQMYFNKIIQHFLNTTLAIDNESSVRSSIFAFKYLILNFSSIDTSVVEIRAIIYKLICILLMDFNSSIKNTTLDCLYQILSIDKLVLFKIVNSSISSDDIVAFKNLEGCNFTVANSETIPQITENADEELKEVNETLNLSLDASSNLLTEQDMPNLTSLDINLTSLEQLDAEKEYLDGYLPTQLDENEIKDEMNQFDNEKLDEAEETKDDKNRFELKNVEIVQDETILVHLVKIIMTEYLFESIPDDSSLSFLQSRRCRTNCKILAFNLLQQILVMKPSLILQKCIVINDVHSLPSIFECIQHFCSDDDSQLSGAAFFLIGKAVDIMYSCTRDDTNSNMQTIKNMVENIKCFLIEPKSGQHLKSILNCIRHFLWNLSSSNQYSEAIDIIMGVLKYSQHSYKLVKKEIIAILSQCINYENILYYIWSQNFNEQGLKYRKEPNIPEIVIDTMMTLITDSDQEIRTEACEAYQQLIDKGAFNSIDMFTCSSCRHKVYSKFYKSESLTSNMRPIPFLDDCINVNLAYIRDAHLKKSTECQQHNDIQAHHKAVCLIAERLIEIPTSFSRDMKVPLHKFSGYSHCLVILLKSRKVQIDFPIPMDRILSLLQITCISSDLSLHSDLLYLSTQLFLLNSLPPNNSTLQHSQLLTHLCRVLNIFWHSLQFLTPVMPAHKTIIPSLVSTATGSAHSDNSNISFSSSSSKRRTANTASPSKMPTSSSTITNVNIDSRPPRTKAALGFCVNLPLYTTLHRIITVAYSSSLVSPIELAITDRLVLPLLQQTIQSLTTLLDYLSFNDVSQHTEEIISYATVFYQFLPFHTVQLIIRLLSALFGTNLYIQWDPFLSSIYQSVSFTQSANNNTTANTDSPDYLMNKYRIFVRNNGANTQTMLSNISTGANNVSIQELDSILTNLYSWIRAVCKRREPGILKQINSSKTNANTPNSQVTTKPNLTHYIGLFEKIVFQCMRQYLASKIHLQTAIVELLCQLINLRVNYCQLDSEQKFLSMIINQLENASSIPINADGVKELIVTIVDFLILLTYERGGTGNSKNKPIISLSDVVRIIESLMASGINLDNIMIPCVWKLVCDLYVNRTVWLNTPNQYNLLPTQESFSETELLRETILELILRKLVEYPKTMEIISLILEQSARKHELNWENVSFKVWSVYSKVFKNNEMEISKKSHIDQFDNMMRLIKLSVLTNTDVSLIDLAIYDGSSVDLLAISPDELTKHVQYVTRVTICFNWVLIQKLEFWKLNSEYLSQFPDDDSKKHHFIKNAVSLLQSIIGTLKVIQFNSFVRQNIQSGLVDIFFKCAERLLLAFTDLVSSIDTDTVYGQSFNLKLFSEAFNEILNQELINELPLDHMKLLWKELCINLDMHKNKDVSQIITKIDHSFIPSVNSSSLIVFSDSKFNQNLFLQQCRFLESFYESNNANKERFNSIQQLISQNYTLLIHNFDDPKLTNIMACIYRNKDLGLSLLDVLINDMDVEILKNSNYAMKWASVLENLHIFTTNKLIELIKKLTINTIDDPYLHLSIPFVLKLKMDVILVSKLEALELSSDSILQETVKSMQDLVYHSLWPFSTLRSKLSTINSIESPSLMTDGVSIQQKNEEIFQDSMSGKNYWYKAIENALSPDYYHDSRLAARLLQGGQLSDVESIFQVSISMTPSGDADDNSSSASETKSQPRELPYRFIQQCIRLGFLRSGGGSNNPAGIALQEGSIGRVDQIFRVGEKLLFNQLHFCVESSKRENQLNPCDPRTLSLLVTLNEYFKLSCQLSIPMPLSMSQGIEVFEFVKLLSRQLTVRQIVPRLLLEELLPLISYCFSNSFNLLSDEEGLKLFSHDVVTLHDHAKPIITLLHQLMFHTKAIETKLESMIIECCDHFEKLAEMRKCCCSMCTKIHACLVSVIRLPCILPWVRFQQLNDQPSSLVMVTEPSMKKLEIDLNCLGHLDRDELCKTESNLAQFGWVGRHMFEETWLLYLGLLHDEYAGGGSNSQGGASDDDTELSRQLQRVPEEIVEQGHCDSIGLMGLTDLLLKTTLKPYPGNPIDTQLEHKPRDKTPFLLHTKIGRKLSQIHAVIEEELFQLLNGFRLLYSGWSFSSWNLEREESLLQYRHEQININILAKRISIEGRSPQITPSPQLRNPNTTSSTNDVLDIVSCLQSLPIILDQWLHPVQLSNLSGKSRSLWPRACALKAAVMLMDLFSSREQVQWLMETILNLTQFSKLEDDWISLSWCCIGLCKCVAVLESSKPSTTTSTTTTMPHYIQQHPVTSASIQGLIQAVKLAEICLQSDITCAQHAALHSAMFLLQMTVHGSGRMAWECAPGSLVELHTFYRLVMNHLEIMLIQLDPISVASRRESIADMSTASMMGASMATLSHSVTSKAATLANSMSSLSSSVSSINSNSTFYTQPNASLTSISNQFNATNSSTKFATSRFSKSQNNQQQIATNNNNSAASISSSISTNAMLAVGTRYSNPNLRTEKHSLLVMATACYFCERFPDALQESDLLNNFVGLAKNILQTSLLQKTNAENSIQYERMNVSNKFVVTLCRCIERILLTQRASNIVIEEIIRICSGYLSKYRSSSYSLSVLGLFLTSCYMSLTNNTSQPSVIPANFESIFHCSPANWSPDSQLIVLERMNLLWKRLIDPDCSTGGVNAYGGNFESRLLSRTVSSVMIEFLSGSEMLNKTIHQLLISWPHSQFVAKSLFDMILACLNQPDGQKEIRKWVLMILPSLVSSTPEVLSVWSITVVLVACTPNTRAYLRSLFSVLLNWLIQYERNMKPSSPSIQASSPASSPPSLTSSSSLSNSTPIELEDLFCLSALSFLQDLAATSTTTHSSSSSAADDMTPSKDVFMTCIHSRKEHVGAFARFYQLACDKNLV